MKFVYESNLLQPSQLNELFEKHVTYIQHLQSVIRSKSYEALESSINLPSDGNILKNVLEMKSKKVTPQLKYIIDIGIGGSNLGTKAIYDSFFGYFDILHADRFPKIIFLDTTDPEFIFHFSEFIKKNIQHPDEILINAISKSGGTTETIANLEITLDLLKKKIPDIEKRLVITTDENSKLWEASKEKNVDVLSIPKMVGGRYSVLSAVGLFPLAAVGINIELLLQGAEEMRAVCTSSDLEKNDAFISAATIYLHQLNHKNINDTFIFHPELESIGKWYRQLMGESIGKENDLDGNVVHAGVTPTVSIGSTDLHSVGQLYLGGPQDKTTTFVYTEKNNNNVTIPSQLQFPLVEGITNKKTSEIMKAILEGTKIAYKKQHLPFVEVILEEINEKELGAFLQFKMIEMMYLGKMLQVNTFDQPHVELYKVETKKILNT
jgi:glucose-6-phosphate isomerase